jgi:hypothetical protein
MSASGYRQAQVCEFTLKPMLMALIGRRRREKEVRVTARRTAPRASGPQRHAGPARALMERVRRQGHGGPSGRAGTHDGAPRRSACRVARTRRDSTSFSRSSAATRTIAASSPETRRAARSRSISTSLLTGRGLLHRAVALAHAFRQRHAAPGGLGQVTRA